MSMAKPDMLLRSWLVVLSTIIFASAGCGKSSKSSSDAWVIDDLSGNWVIGCHSSPYFPGATHALRTLSISNGTYTYSQDGFSDASCSSKVLSIVETGSLSVIGGKGSAQVRAVNFTQGSFTAVALTAGVTNTWNTTGSASNAAGVTIPELCYRMVPTDTDADASSPLVPDPVGEQFTLGVTKDIAVMNCSAGHINPANGSTVLSVYSLSSSPDTLTLGSPSTAQLGVLVVGKVVDTIRPSTLDETMKFTRQ